jgi:uncharacterized membrane protein YccC
VREDDPQHQRKRPLSAGRLAVTIAGALVLIALVVMASRGDRPSGAVDTGGKTTSTVVINISLLVLAIVAAGMVVMVLFSFQPGRSAMPQPRTGPKLLGQLLGLLLLCGVAFVVLASIRNGWTRNQGQTGADSVAAALRQLQRKAPSSGEGIDWVPAGIVFAATMVGLAALGVVYMRRQPLPEPDAALRDRLAQLFDETLHDLYAEEDPRRAVIGAYSRMERILANYDMERRSSEAPHEYVSRVLEQVVASGSSVRRLTRLYERARFSPHTIDPAMKNEAIAAVEAIRDELRAREAEALVVAPQ